MKKLVMMCSALVLVSSPSLAQDARKGGIYPVQVPPASTGPITPENNPELFSGKPVRPVFVPPASTGPITPENNPDLFHKKPVTRPIIDEATTGPITPENSPDIFGRKGGIQNPDRNLPTTGPITPENNPGLFNPALTPVDVTRPTTQPIHVPPANFAPVNVTQPTTQPIQMPTDGKINPTTTPTPTSGLVKFPVPPAYTTGPVNGGDLNSGITSGALPATRGR